MEVEDDIFLASQDWEKDVFSGAAHTWEQLELLKRKWDGPIVLKGIQHVEDAKMAVEAGVDGIVVSNHGGRQLDGAIGSLEMLPEIVEAVGDRLTILFDSGIRTGVDIIKALCLGAKGVLIGRYDLFKFYSRFHHFITLAKLIFLSKAFRLWSCNRWQARGPRRAQGSAGGKSIPGYHTPLVSLRLTISRILIKVWASLVSKTSLVATVLWFDECNMVATQYQATELPCCSDVVPHI